MNTTGCFKLAILVDSPHKIPKAALAFALDCHAISGPGQKWSGQTKFGSQKWSGRNSFGSQSGASLASHAYFPKRNSLDNFALPVLACSLVISG